MIPRTIEGGAASRAANKARLFAVGLGEFKISQIEINGQPDFRCKRAVVFGR